MPTPTATQLELPAQRPEPWRASVLTLYPDMFPGPLGLSLVGQALANGRWRLETRNIRDHGAGRHAQVDDTPTGKVGQHRTKGGPLRGTVQPADLSIKSRIASQEIRIVVNVLRCHRGSSTRVPSGSPHEHGTSLTFDRDLNVPISVVLTIVATTSLS